MNKLLSLQDKIDLATKYNLEPNVLLAVMAVECSGSGFNKDGSIKIQFEPYWFNHYTGVRIPNSVEGQVVEYEAFKIASEKDEESAYLSTSFGILQIMGFNHKSTGYTSAKLMAESFKLSEYNQLEGGLKHIISKPKMYKALQTKDWAIFAYYYNGKEYKQFNYDNRLNEAYNKLKG